MLLAAWISCGCVKDVYAAVDHISGGEACVEFLFVPVHAPQRHTNAMTDFTLRLRGDAVVDQQGYHICSQCSGV